jgi:hypothetical protein
MMFSVHWEVVLEEAAIRQDQAPGGGDVALNAYLSGHLVVI